MRMVACFALRSLPHELACRLAKRHGLQNPKDPRDYQMAEKARTLYRKADAAGLAVLVFEAMCFAPPKGRTENKDDDPLSIAASLQNRHEGSQGQRRQRGARESAEKAKKTAGKEKPKPKAKLARK